MDPMLISAAAQAGAGVVQGVTGIIQTAQAKKMAKNNKRPTYKIQQENFNNQELIESRAGQGLSDAALQVLQQNNQRGLSASLDAVLAGGGSVNNVGDLYGNFSDGVSKMALIDEEMRTRNIQNLIAQNQSMAAEKDKAWQVNVWAPYADKAQAAAVLQKQGSDNIWKGVNSVLGAGQSAAAGGLFKKEADNVYGNSGVTGATASNGSAAPGGLGELNFATNPQMWGFTPNNNAQRPTQSEQAATSIQYQFPGLIPGSIIGGQIYKKY